MNLAKALSDITETVAQNKYFQYDLTKCIEESSYGSRICETNVLNEDEINDALIMFNNLGFKVTVDCFFDRSSNDYLFVLEISW